MQDIPERPRAINPDIPAGLEEIVLRTMEKNPDDRYPSTVEMIADIEAFKNDPDIVFGYYQEVDEGEYYYEDAPENYNNQPPNSYQNNNSYPNNSNYQNGYSTESQQPPRRPQGNYRDYDDEDEEEERWL